MQNFRDLIWNREGNRIELAIQARIPDNLRTIIYNSDIKEVRYEISIHLSESEYSIQEEKILFLNPEECTEPFQRSLFPFVHNPVNTILTPNGKKGTKVIVSKRPGGNDKFYSEIVREANKTWAPSFKLGPKKSAFGNLVDDIERFPVSTWLRDFLTNGIQSFLLNSTALKHMSPPGQGSGFSMDGSNLPWVIDDLRKKNPILFKRWVSHIKTALPDIVDISTELRPDIFHRYIKIKYTNGLEVPSWMISDGTLRLLALTLPAYLSKNTGAFLIEEPENGIHPRAIETIYQSLSSVYDSQVMLTTHSPIILNLASLSDILCFAKTQIGSTDIVSGEEHPLLKEWQSSIQLGTLLASGVLG